MTLVMTAVILVPNLTTVVQMKKVVTPAIYMQNVSLWKEIVEQMQAKESTEGPGQEERGETIFEIKSG
jgi:hypothetical protein